MTQLKFMFANHDNASHPVVLSVKGDTTLESVRASALAQWPATVDKPDRPADVRLFCMGRVLDARTISACSIPAFDDFPTPVHVSGKPSRKAIAAERKAEAAGEGCCVVS